MSRGYLKLFCKTDHDFLAVSVTPPADIYYEYRLMLLNIMGRTPVVPPASDKSGNKSTELRIITSQANEFLKDFFASLEQTLFFF